MNLLEASKALEECLSILNHWSSYIDNHYKQKWGYDKDVQLIEKWIQECRASHESLMKSQEDIEERIQILHSMIEDKWW